MQLIAQIDDSHERRRQAALRVAKVGVFEYEPQTDTAFWDETVHRFWGIPADETMTYDKIVGQVHPDDQELHHTASAAAFDPNGNGQMDMIYRLYPRDGQPMRWIHTVASCYFKDGKPQRLVGTVRDITAQKEAETHNKLLIYELEHRVKNTLATAIAIADLSRLGAHAPNDYFNAVEERLRALAASVDMLRRSHWTPVAFTSLVAQAADSYLADPDGRLDCAGPDPQVSAHHVMMISMALHELFTNAAKYGALAAPKGRITLTTEQTADGTTIVTWRESGVTSPGSGVKGGAGFGSVLLDSILPAELGGQAIREMTPEGLRFTFDIPQGKGGKS